MRKKKQKESQEIKKYHPITFVLHDSDAKTWRLFLDMMEKKRSEIDSQSDKSMLVFTEDAFAKVFFLHGFSKFLSEQSGIRDDLAALADNSRDDSIFSKKPRNIC